MSEKRETDRRIVRTRQMLSDALFALIVERGYDSLTVQDIADRANIGRATFYLHYHDKEQLLNDSLKRLFNALTQSIKRDKASSATYQTLSVLVFRHVEQYQQLYRALLAEAGPPLMALRIRKYLAEIIEQDVIKPFVAQNTVESAVPYDLLATHAAGSLLGLIAWWLEHRLMPTAEEMGQLFWRLMTRGIDNVLGLKRARDVS